MPSNHNLKAFFFCYLLSFLVVFVVDRFSWRKCHKKRQINERRSNKKLLQIIWRNETFFLLLFSTQNLIQQQNEKINKKEIKKWKDVKKTKKKNWTLFDGWNIFFFWDFCCSVFLEFNSVILKMKNETTSSTLKLTILCLIHSKEVFLACLCFFFNSRWDETFLIGFGSLFNFLEINSPLFYMLGI